LESQFQKKIYHLKRENAANQDDEVKKAQKMLSDSGASSMNDSLSIYRERRWLTWKKSNNAGAKWAEAKDAWKPLEKYQEKRAASNPEIIAFFFLLTG
jgi:hypothetical protein